MKKHFIIIFIFIATLTSCYDLVYDINPAYETANITSVQIYNQSQISVVNTLAIDTSAQTVNVVIKDTEDITKLKLSATISTGATITPSMSVGFQDLSQPKIYKVTSPNKTITKDWTITVTK